MTSDELMTAGRFGSRTLLSAKALRIYADSGLLPPRHVDPSNGYRYYAEDQIATGWLIGLLRSAELPLEAIGEILRADPESALALLERFADDLDRRTEGVRGVLARARHHLREEPTVTTTDPRDPQTAAASIVSALEPDRPVLSVQARMRPEEMDEVVRIALGRLRRLAASTGLQPVDDPFGVFHAPVTDDSDGPLEIVLPVDGLAEVPVSEADVRSYRMAGGLVASRLAVAPETDFPRILALYDEVHSWITDAGRVPVGPPREIWHTSPRGPEPLRLTIAWPYATPPI